MNQVETEAWTVPPGEPELHEFVAGYPQEKCARCTRGLESAVHNVREMAIDVDGRAFVAVISARKLDDGDLLFVAELPGTGLSGKAATERGAVDNLGKAIEEAAAARGATDEIPLIDAGLPVVDGRESLIDTRRPSQPELVVPTLRESLAALHETQATFGQVDVKFGKIKEQHKAAKENVERAARAVIEAAEREVTPVLPLSVEDGDAP